MDIVNTMVWSAVGLFCYGKLAIAISFAQGYGVKQGVTKILGMPILLFVGFSLISILVIGLLHVAYQIDERDHLLPATINNLRAVSWSMAVGVATALSYWYFYARHELFHQSEYNIRCECKLRNETEEATEATIAEYRRMGIIRA